MVYRGYLWIKVVSPSTKEKTYPVQILKQLTLPSAIYHLYKAAHRNKTYSQNIPLLDPYDPKRYVGDCINSKGGSGFHIPPENFYAETT